MPDVFCRAAGHCENGGTSGCTLKNITLSLNGSCEQYQKKEFIYSKGHQKFSTIDPKIYGTHFGILLFFQDKINRNHVFDVLQKWRGFNIAVDFIDINLMLGPTADSEIIDKVAQMIVYSQYHECYIIPEQRRLRQALKKLLEENTGQELKHFKLYKKVVEAVNKRSMWK